MSSLSCSKSQRNERGSQNARDDDLQLWISSGQMIQVDEELQPITCLCILAQRGCAAPQLWRNKDTRSTLVFRSSPSFLSLFAPRHCCPPRVPISPLIFTSSFASKSPKEAPWTRIMLNMRDIFSVITKDLKVATQQDTMNQHKFIIFCNEDIPPQFFSDFCYAQSCWKSMGNTFSNSDNRIMSNDLQNFTSNWPDGPNTDGSQERQSEMVVRDNLNTCNLKSLLKSCQNYNHPSGKKRNIKKRKTVSFFDDVMVYLFDQDSPTLELHPEPCTSLPGNLSDVTLDDSGNMLKYHNSGFACFTSLATKTCILNTFIQIIAGHLSLSQSLSFCPKPACSSPMSLSLTLSCEIKGLLKL
ncbi:class A basic helix-loop-helix protein 15 isoform X1 [Scomber scombrus]|uniref:Class A basic helix-loop-helix protein 15 isoform X1 n=1 Tax=Scomber scombrus TaxID=13677 RepID=A0AAV1Q407_SCOSC